MYMTFFLSDEYNQSYIKNNSNKVHPSSLRYTYVIHPARDYGL